MGREFELKYAAEPTQLAGIEAEFGDFALIFMETIYYDTPDGDLSARRITLRRRMENGISVCTVKTPGKDGSRGEWEVICEDIRLAIPELCKLGGPKELTDFAEKGLIPMCGARFLRKAKLQEQCDCTVELALDQGVLLGGGREVPLHEVEVELKSGNEAAAVAFAEELAGKYGLKPEKKSKFQRANDLAKG